MNYIKLIYLSIFCGVIAILSFFNIVYSYYLNLYLNLNTYVYSFSVSIFLALLFYLPKTNEEKKITIYEKILTIFLGYFLLPLIIFGDSISTPFSFSFFGWINVFLLFLWKIIDTVFDGLSSSFCCSAHFWTFSNPCCIIETIVDGSELLMIHFLKYLLDLIEP